jgi:predicted O-methyltransferase YrrM
MSIRLLDRAAGRLRRRFFTGDAEMKTPLVAEGPSTGPLDGIREAMSALDGWCSEAKSVWLYNTVTAERPDTIVEVGIFGGRSLVPMALALKANGRGVAYGIESWSPDAATRYATNDANDDWWQKVDYGSVKRKFFDFIVRRDLLDVIKVVEADSHKAHLLFEGIDMLHIDGGHSPFGAAADVVHYGPRVRPGGIIVFDDIDWPTTKPAVAALENIADHVGEIQDEASGTSTCAIFRKR